MKFKSGDRVAVHFNNDNFVKSGSFASFYEYPENGMYKKCKIIKIKKHWNYFFREMALLSDGTWYDESKLTPIITFKNGVEK